MGTALFDTHLIECCVYSPSLSRLLQSTSERLLVDVSDVAAGMLFLYDYQAPHASMILFSSACYPLAWVLMKNALRIALLS